MYFMKTKNETFGVFKKFKSLVKNLKDFKIKMLRIDYGGEYMFKEFTQFCEQNGIARQFTIMDTPHQNGIVEHKNRTILDKAKSMSLNNNVPPYLWTKAINTTTYFMNISPSRSIGGHIPKEIYSRKEPKVDNLRCMDAWCMFSHPKLKGTSWKVAIRNACSLGTMFNPRFINVLT